MAGSTFLDLNKAAEMLGMSPEKLVELRSNGDVRGFRDGASWKFKSDDLQRYAEENGISFGKAAATAKKASDLDSLSFDDDLDDLMSVTDEAPSTDADASSILVSEEELGHSEEKTSSTIIGRGLKSAADSDLKLATEGSSIELDSGSGVSINESNFLGGGKSAKGGSGKGKKPPASSDLELLLDNNAESDVKLVAGGGDDIDLGIAADSELSLDEGSGKGLAGKPSGKLPKPGASSDLKLKKSSAMNSDLSLAGDNSDLPLSGGKKTGAGSDALSLGDDDMKLGEDDDLVLGSGMGSDVTLSSDSGINLNRPSDSGLSLEDEPLDLGGSGISSLELPEDDAISVEDPADADAATQLRQDEEFSLGPSDDFGEDDSGSQVIALEDSEAFDSDANTLLQQAGGLEAEDQNVAGAAMGNMFDAFGASPAMGPAGGGGGMPAGGMAPMPAAGAVASIPEAPYTIWNVLGLLCVLMAMSLSLMLTVDVIRNMWAWNEESTASLGTSLMEGLVNVFGFKSK